MEDAGASAIVAAVCQTETLQMVSPAICLCACQVMPACCGICQRVCDAMGCSDITYGTARWICGTMTSQQALQ
eukprot:2360708-Rhodomonas_salina.1